MIDKTARKNLLIIVGVFARAKKISLSAVSRDLYGKGNFLADFRTGRQGMSFSTMARMLRKLAEEWPAGVEWPQTEPLSMGRPELGKKPRKIV